MGKWTTGTKRVAGKTYRVVKRGGAWLIMQGANLVGMFIKGVIYTFSREVGRHLARRIFMAKVAA